MEFELTPEEIKLFLEEAEEQLEVMEETLVSLEADPTDAGLLQEMFRAAHTLKGGAATAGFEDVAGVTHAMESLMDVLRNGKRPFGEETADLLFEGVDILKRCLAQITGNGSGDPVDTSACIARLKAMSDASGSDDSPESSGAQSPRGDAWSQAGDVPPEAVRAAQEEAASGRSVGEWRIAIDPKASMASVRAYQVLMELEETGRVLCSRPRAEELEDQAVASSPLRVIVATSLTVDQVRERVAEIPDVAGVEYTPWGDGSPKPEEPTEERTEDRTEGPTESRSDFGVSSPAAKAGGGLGQTVRIGVELLDRLMNLVGELVIDRTRLAQLTGDGKGMQNLHEDLTQVAGHLSRITTDLQDTIMQARMVPLESLFKKFPRMIRDLSKQLDKSIAFRVSGEETELDRSVIEQIGDPLIHLLRNAVDHGIESEDERKQAGKAAEGLVSLSAYHQENHIYIQVRDDGRGLDPERLKRSALEKGIITEEQASRMSRDEAVDLIFAPGFSTARSVSTVSGRGVGMDVVRRNIERVNGTIDVETELGRGTAFTIKLPLTLAILHALMIDVGGGVYAIPLSNVVEAVRVGESDVHHANGWPMISVRGEMVPLLDPGHTWGEGAHIGWSEGNENPVVVIQSGPSPIGLQVSRLLGEQEIVIKNMGRIVGDVPGISGASILGDGRVALIVDVAGLVKEVRQVA